MNVKFMIKTRSHGWPSKIKNQFNLLTISKVLDNNQQYYYWSQELIFTHFFLLTYNNVAKSSMLYLYSYTIYIIGYLLIISRYGLIFVINFFLK